MIFIDGERFDVDVVSLKRQGDSLHKYAERTDDGVLNSELIGRYFNYQIKFGPNRNQKDYDRLWEKLNEAVEYHVVTVPYGANSQYSYEAYFSNVSDELLCQHPDNNAWHNLTANFKARVPARRSV